MNSYKTLRMILGDQLSPQIATLSDVDKKNDIIFMCEVWDETQYVKHHKKKIAFLFSAMRHFAEELRENGYTVDYVKLDDADNTGSFSGEVERAIERYQLEKLVVTSPGEYRVLKMMHGWQESLSCEVEIREDCRFLATTEYFNEWAKGRKSLRMEYFYREMRKKHNVLMEGGSPVGGEWNYDSENRKPPKEGLDVPATYNASIDNITKEVMSLVAKNFDDHFGDLEPFYFAVTRDQARMALKQFIDERLVNFGSYQDAMVQDEPWMFHAHISFYLNCGLLLPMECVEAAEKSYREDGAPLNAVEGFIRQILGWREFIRGIYWRNMPEYDDANYLEANRALPDFYWTAATKMNCLRQCVSETKENAYAHHIQRLMVLGNFALIAGLDPEEVSQWFLIVYADAYQWVELPNVKGMVLFADGGEVASKPYAAGGGYINKMSNYCKHCSYKVTTKNGPEACPFNYLYWDFLVRNREIFANNPRIAVMYRTYDRMSKEKHDAIADDSRRFLKALDYGEKV